MKKFLYTSIVISVSLFALFYSLFKLTDNVIAETLYSTFMTFSYYFIIRSIEKNKKKWYNFIDV